MNAGERLKQWVKVEPLLYGYEAYFQSVRSGCVCAGLMIEVCPNSLNAAWKPQTALVAFRCPYTQKSAADGCVVGFFAEPGGPDLRSGLFPPALHQFYGTTRTFSAFHGTGCLLLLLFAVVSAEVKMFCPFCVDSGAMKIFDRLFLSSKEQSCALFWFISLAH